MNNVIHSPIGNASPVGAPKLIRLRPASRIRLPEIQTGTAFLSNQNLAIPDELVHGVIHRGTTTVIPGPSKSNKSWIGIDLAVSVASGSDFWNWHTTQAPVLYVNLEIPPVFFKQRLEKVIEAKGLKNLDALDVWNLRGHLSDPDDLVEAILERAGQGRYGIIIIDPVYKLIPGGSENAASRVVMLCQRFERINTDTQASVVYLHHFSKGNQSNKKAMDRMSGSGVFARDADTIITLTEHQEEGCFSVEMTLRNFPEQMPFVVEKDFPLMVVRPDLDPADLRTKEITHDDKEEYLLDLLVETPLTTTDWQRAADSISRATFHRVKARLKAAGKVVCDPESDTWSIAETRSQAETGET